jgi:hypothetical protein
VKADPPKAEAKPPVVEVSAPAVEVKPEPVKAEPPKAEPIKVELPKEAKTEDRRPEKFEFAEAGGKGRKEKDDFERDDDVDDVLTLAVGKGGQGKAEDIIFRGSEDDGPRPGFAAVIPPWAGDDDHRHGGGHKGDDLF